MGKAAWKRFFVKRRRKDLRFVSYGEAEALLQQGWVIAKEEDDNRVLGMVYLECFHDDVSTEVKGTP